MHALRLALLLCSFFSLAATSKTSLAFGGYPPFGAWAYGSGHDVYRGGHWGAGYHGWGITTGYRTHYSRWGHVGWGPTVAHHRRWYPTATWYATAFTVPVVRTTYYYPAAYLAPTVYAPTFFTLPVYDPCYNTAVHCLPATAGPSCWPNDSVSYVDPLSGRLSADETSTEVEGGVISLTSYTRHGWQAGDQAADATPAAMAPSAAIPSQLIASADAIMQAGGYRQAATAYAQLNVRYGSSDEIFSRRFIAQVACHDWDQAAVVLASAQVAGYHIQRSHLPAGTLAALLSGNAQEVGRLTESLAAHSLSATDQGEAMHLMGVWLGLSGDDTRAALFLTMAEKLSREIPVSQPVAEPVNSEELTAPHSKSAHTSIE